jgi:hypothetical protein
MKDRQNAAGHAAYGGWAESLRSSDAGQLWRNLHRLVRNHPLVRSHSSAPSLRWSANETCDDLTQELFVTLLSKDRFRHYIDAGMSDREIESEIGQIELTNLLTTGLRKRYPESYRLARRISVLLQTSSKFKRFDAALKPGGRPLRLSGQVYGLSRWPEGMQCLPSDELERRISSVPVRGRDRRMKGRTGDTQLVIGNAELEGLIVEVLEAMGSPANVRTLRGLVLSRLPVLDVSLTQFRVAGEERGGADKTYEPADGGPSPEQEALLSESGRNAGARVEEFLRSLSAAVGGKARQYERMLCVLWLCYLSPEHPTQLETAARLGVSDSLVSDYRRRIGQQLRSLSLGSLEEARRFEEALLLRVKPQVETYAPAGRGHVTDLPPGAAKPIRCHQPARNMSA